MRADLVTVIFRASMSVAYSTAIRAADVASDDRAAPTHPGTRETSLADSEKHHWQIPLRAEKSPRCDRTTMIRGFSRPILNS